MRTKQMELHSKVKNELRALQAETGCTTGVSKGINLMVWFDAKTSNGESGTRIFEYCDDEGHTVFLRVEK